jgi:hypothetical protein
LPNEQPPPWAALVAHCHFGLGKLYRRSGSCQQADEHLAAAAVLYREMQMPHWLKQMEAEANNPQAADEVNRSRPW